MSQSLGGDFRREAAHAWPKAGLVTLSVLAHQLPANYLLPSRLPSLSLFQCVDCVVSDLRSRQARLCDCGIDKVRFSLRHLNFSRSLASFLGLPYCDRLKISLRSPRVHAVLAENSCVRACLCHGDLQAFCEEGICYRRQRHLPALHVAVGACVCACVERWELLAERSQAQTPRRPTLTSR